MKNLKSAIGSILSIAVLAGLALPALAMPNPQTANIINIKTGNSVATIVVPETAMGNSETIVPLGQAVDQGKVVSGFAIISYKEAQAKPGSGGSGSTSASSCYAFLADSARWKATENYVLGTGIDPLAVSRDVAKWNSKVSFKIFGTQDTTRIADGADILAPDGKNEIMFGSISNPSEIGVTIVWGVFGGTLTGREIVEYDIVFDNADYAWGDASTNASVMDVENIETHELGHAAGMADLYASGCSEQTMYGYAGAGETKKRTLEIGDITGIKKLYK